MSLRWRLVAAALAVGLIGAGLLLWREWGSLVWLDAALAFCL